MALWKPFRGSRADLDAVAKRDGYVYFCDDGALFFDYTDKNGNLQRKQINAKDAETLTGMSLDQIQKSISWNDLLNKPELGLIAVYDEISKGLLTEDVQETLDKIDTIESVYETKTGSSIKLDEAKAYADANLETAKSYTDEKIANIPAVDSYTKPEIDAALENKANNDHDHDDIYYTEAEIDVKLSGKSDTGHTHSNYAPTSRTVNGKELSSNITLSASDVGADASGSANTALNSAKSYTDDAIEALGDTYYTEAEIDTKLASKSDSTHNHDSKYDTKGSASAVQTNLDVVSDTLDSHTDDSDIHVTTTNKSNWNTAYTHSQSTHARTDATKVADSTTNGNILINGSETNVYTHPNSGVTAGTYKSVTVNAQGHVTGGTNPTTLAGYGITDAETKGAASSALASAKEYTDSVASGKANTNHNHDTTYDKKGAADSALASAKSYADSAATTAANAVKNDLLNGAGTAYDTLKELGDLIDDNADAIDALETVAAGKADKTHTHAISDVSGLQSALDGKAASSHGTHVSYSATAPVMDGTASVGTASTVARSDHKHPTDTSRASKTEFDSHTSNTTAHITSTERSNWNAAKTHADSAHAPSNAEKNQNAFSNIKVGSTTVAADAATDTVEFVGSNVTITPDTTNDKVTFTVADGSTSGKGVVQLTNSTSSTSTTTAATPSSVKSAYDLANTAKTNAATAQSRADSAYSLAEGKVDSLSDLGVTATATELNYVDGVTSNIQTQLDGKAPSSHNQSASTITSGTLSSDRLPTVPISKGGTGATTAAGALTNLGITATAAELNKMDGVTATTTELNYVDGVTSNIQTQLDGKLDKTTKYAGSSSTGGAANSAVKATQDGSGNTITSTYATKAELDSAKSSLQTSINGKANSSHIHSISNVTNLQSSLDAKQATVTGAATTITGSNLTASRALISNSSGKVAVSDITSTELAYLDGVTSNIQTQLDARANKSDIATTIMQGTATQNTTYWKISGFGNWGTGTWMQKGFSMLITSRAGEMVWVSLAANDSNTSAGAIRLINRYSKIAAIHYSVSESAIYVTAAGWANNICAHILSNVNGDYVPTIASASALPSDAVSINIIEFGIDGTGTVVGDNSVPLAMGGSTTRPTYNSKDLALKSDVDAITLDTLGGNDRYYTESEIDSKVSTLNTAINGKAASSHTHDDRYYTEAEINAKVDTLNTAIAGKAPSVHSHGHIQDGTVGMKTSDSNEVSFSSNANYIYFGYDNRMGSTGIVDTYKFGKHSGTASAADGNIECGSLAAGRTLKGGTVTVGNAATLQYDSTNQCLNFVFG